MLQLSDDINGPTFGPLHKLSMRCALSPLRLRSWAMIGDKVASSSELYLQQVMLAIVGNTFIPEG